MIKKTAVISVLLLLLSSVFAFAQETGDADDIYGAEAVEECGIGCKIWQFLFGSRGARAGKAWLDRSEPLVGMAEKQEYSVTYKTADGIYVSIIVPAESEEKAKQAVETIVFYYELNQCTECEITSITLKGEKEVKPAAPKPITPAPTQKPIAATIPYGFDQDALKLKHEADDLYREKKYSDALSKYDEFLAKYHLNWKVYANRGKTLEKLGKYNEAAQSYQKALEDKNIPEDEKTNMLAFQSNAISEYLKQPDTNKQLKETGIKGTFDGKDGTFTLDKDGKHLFFQPTTGNPVEVQENSLSQVQIGTTSPELSTAIGLLKENARTLLGEPLYNQYESANLIDWEKSGWMPDKPGVVTYTLKGGAGTITAVPGAQGFVTVTATVPGLDGKPTQWSALLQEGQLIASQTAEELKQGVMQMGSNREIVSTGEGITPNMLKSGKPVTLKEEGENVGSVQYDPLGNTLTVTNTKDETQKSYDFVTGTKKDLGGDWYPKKDKCSQDGGCFVPVGGTTQLVVGGKVTEYWTDYDYENSFDDRIEEKPAVEYYTPNGQFEGIQFSDGGSLFALKDENGKYNGLFEYADAADTAGVSRQVRKNKFGDWEFVSEEVTGSISLNNLNKKSADKLESSTQGTLAATRGVLQSIYAITGNLKSYPAISNLLFGEAEFYKDWRRKMDQAFAPLLGSSWVPSAVCEIGVFHWNDIEPEGKAVIKTVSGTYQAVASIQMERSPETSPILCHKNPDEESEELFICGSRQICIDENFCYADQDRDNEPDSSEPLKGYFYKITWAVSSPQDEALTPLRDENGVAVSFNIFLYPGAVPMYDLNGNIASPIQLQNGASDKDTIIKYSTNVYDRACIKWNQAPVTVTVPGGEDVGDVCFDVVTSSVGKVNWERSGQNAASVTVSHGELNRNTDW